jgi:hypothetical protein
LIKSKIREGHFSRDAYDISIALDFFATQFQKSNGRDDIESYKKLLKDLRFM